MPFVDFVVVDEVVVCIGVELNSIVAVCAVCLCFGGCIFHSCRLCRLL